MAAGEAPGKYVGHPSTVIRTLATYQAHRRVYPNWPHLCYSENFLKIKSFSDSPSGAGTVEGNPSPPSQEIRPELGELPTSRWVPYLVSFIALVREPTTSVPRTPLALNLVHESRIPWGKILDPDKIKKALSSENERRNFMLTTVGPQLS